MSEVYTGFIPKKFYVTRKMESAENVLGFMQPAHKEGFTKRKESADKWAASNYGRGQYSTFDPIEIENVPLAGFALVEFTRRYTTSNVVWRLIHPEGFEFEITSENFDYLIRNTTIQKGVIMDMCAFVRDGGNVLLPVSCDRFKNTKTEETYFTKVAKKDLSIGDIVTLQGDTTEYVYYGAYHMMSVDNMIETDNHRNDKSPASKDVASKRYHVLLDHSKANKIDKYSFTIRSSAPNVNEVISSPGMTQADALAFVEQHILERNIRLKYNAVVAIQLKPFKLSSVTSQRLVRDAFQVEQYGERTVFAMKDNILYIASCNSNIKRNTSTGSVYFEMRVLATKNVGQPNGAEIPVYEVNTQRGHYGGYQTKYIEHEAFDMVVDPKYANTYWFSSIPEAEQSAILTEAMSARGYTPVIVQYGLK